MRRIFVTGGTGFFGKSILEYRLNHPEFLKDSEITILSRYPAAFCAAHPRLSSQQGLRWAQGDIRTFSCNGEYFDDVVHAAATIDLENIPVMRSSIIDGTRHVIEFARACRAERILYASSGAVYGSRTKPVAETSECIPVTPYGLAKREAEKMLLESGLDVRLARCFAFVGPHLPRNIYYAIGNFIQNSLDGKPIVINGDGTPLRSYLYADDLVEWLFAILDRGESGRPYNVGSDHAVSIRQLAEIVREALGSKSEIVVKGVSALGATPSAYLPIIDRAACELGLSVKVEIEEAIAMSAAKIG